MGYRSHACFVAAIGCLLMAWGLPSTANGQDAKPKLPAAGATTAAAKGVADEQKRQQTCDALAVRAKSADDADAIAAASEAERLVTQAPWFYRRPTKPVVEALLSAHRYEPAERLARMIMFGAPTDWWLVNCMQLYRIQAYLGEDKKDEALAAAKGLYDFADFRQMAEATDEVARVLAAVDPEQGPAKGRRFKLQQQAWAETAPTQGDALGDPVLAALEVDTKPFDIFFNQPPHKDAYVDAMNRGLVLLLADQPAKALEAFQKAEALATKDAQKTDVTMAIARAMRARDQCMAKASAYLASRQLVWPAK